MRARDGVLIAYERNGKGFPLIVVHGTTADHTRWAPVLPVFEQHFTVYAIDRRGRGGSGDAEPYAIEQEFEDVLAVVNEVREPVFLLGHSYGALCCLEAARRTTQVSKLVLDEPPIPTGSEIYPPAVVSRLQAMLTAGDREGALLTFLQEIVQMSAQELELLRSAPTWPVRVAVVHTMLREMQGANAYIFEPARFSSLVIPTLLLLGGESPAYLQAGTQAVHAALPRSQVHVMLGQHHTAMSTAPEVFTREVLTFLAQAD